MATKMFFLEQTGFEDVESLSSFEVCRLHIEPGSYLVVAKGDIRQDTTGTVAMFEFQLEVFSRFGAFLARDIISKFPIAMERMTFLLMVAVTIPHEGGGGAIDPAVGGGSRSFEEARAVLTARRVGTDKGILMGVRIFALPVDEIVRTVI